MSTVAKVGCSCSIHASLSIYHAQQFASGPRTYVGVMYVYLVYLHAYMSTRSIILLAEDQSMVGTNVQCRARKRLYEYNDSKKKNVSEYACANSRDHYSSWSLLRNHITYLIKGIMPRGCVGTKTDVDSVITLEMSLKMTRDEQWEGILILEELNEPRYVFWRSSSARAMLTIVY